MRLPLIAGCMALGVILSFPALAQKPNPLVGTWERFSLKRGETVAQPPEAPEFLIVSADGFFSQTAIPAGRPKLQKPLEQMTKEELLNRFDQVAAARGVYTIVGNVFTRKFVSNLNPNAEGNEQIREFRIEGDTLILTSQGSEKAKTEARFHRVK